jgi:hypothetical protein
MLLVNKLFEDSMTIDPAQAERVDLAAESLSREPVASDIEWMSLPDMARQSKTYTAAREQFVEWAYQNMTVELWYCGLLDAYSQPDEDDGDFRARLLHKAREVRDHKVEEIRLKYAKKIQALDDDYRRASMALEKQRSEARSAKVSTVVSIGQSILGAIFGSGRKSSVISRGATAARGAARAWEQSGDVRGAEERLAAVEQEINNLKALAEQDVADIRRACDMSEQDFEKVSIRPLKKNINVQLYGLAWLPYLDKNGTITPAWQA